MSVELNPQALAALLLRSRDTIQQLRMRLDAHQSAVAEPVALIGMGCRFPGAAADPETFWDVLRSGRDCVRPVGTRWNLAGLAAGKDAIYVREAALLDGDVGAFDAGFFGVSAAEAADLDPQQRLLLEVSWEAIEHAGLAPGSLRGSRTGVFVGIVGCEYGMLPRDPARLGPFAGTGTLTSLAAGRLSYFLGLHGPSLAIDTACSSSLVALHQACESLRRGECDLALAGGVNLLLSPLPLLSLCRIGALAPDGRCKTFDAAGDGYGRGEGCGVVVLRRLESALAQRDPIHAVILGSAVNHDGRSAGLTVPNGQAQRHLIANALERAGVAPAELSYVEAHGTGTSLGDPIEIEALADVLTAGRNRASTLAIGSVKTNIGHLEAAAGIAGVIKTALCLEQQAIPPHLHLREPNPRLPLTRIPAMIPTELQPWVSSGRRVAGVSAFGFSGTNAHVVMAEAPAPAGPDVAAPPRLALLPLSARTRPALDELVARLSAHLAVHPEAGLDAVCFTAAVGRTHFEQRLALLARTREELVARLAALARERASLAPPTVTRPAGRLALLLGPEQPGDAARALGLVWPAFRTEFETCSALLGPTASAQARTFTFGYALARVWLALGPRITSLAGEGVGALTALSAAGLVPVSAAAALLRGEPGAESFAIDADRAELRWISTVTGEEWAPGVRTLDSVWATEVLGTERRLDAAARSLRAAGHDRALALGASVELSQACRAEGLEVIDAGDGWECVVSALALLYEGGAPVAWDAFHAGTGARRIALPTYPFQRSHHWIEDVVAAPPPGSRANDPKGDPLTGQRLLSPLRQVQIEHELAVATLPELGATPVLHAGYYLELLARGLRDALGVDAFRVQEMNFLVALELDGQEARRIQLLLDPDDSQIEFAFWAWYPARKSWLRHVSGRVHIGVARQVPATSADWLGTAAGGMVTHEEFYADLTRRGVDLGPSARWVERIVSSGGGQATAWLRPPAGLGASAGFALGLPPTVYEACLQVFHAALPEDTAVDLRFMAVRLGNLEFDAVQQTEAPWLCRAIIEHGPGAERLLRGRVELRSGAGRWLASAGLVELRGLDAQHVQALRQASRDADATPAASAVRIELVERVRLEAAEPAQARLLAYVLDVLASVLDQAGGALQAEHRFDELGLDSLGGLALKGRLEQDLGLRLPMEAFLDATPASLARVLCDRLKATGCGRAAPAAGAPAQHARERWFAHRATRPRAHWRLFCLPHGGEGASIYRDWPAQFGDNVDVCPVQLPGDEERHAEAPFEDMAEAVAALHDALGPELERPFALYGHSYGALIAYRLAQRLHAHGPRAPAHLFVGAFSAPGHGANPILAAVSGIFARAGYVALPDNATLSALPDDVARELLDFLITRLSGDALFQGRDLLRDLPLQQLKTERLPALVAGLRLVASDRGLDGGTFDVPITAFHGQRDRGAEPGDLEAWGALTTGSFELTVLPGDHFFLRRNQAQAAVIAHINRRFELGTPADSLALRR